MSENKYTYEKLAEVSFNIITYSGEAKSNAMLAIYAAKANNIEEAKQKLEQANKDIIKASEQHVELIQQEAQGNKIDVPLLLLHAEDQLLTTQTLILMAEEFVNLYELVHKK